MSHDAVYVDTENKLWQEMTLCDNCRNYKIRQPKPKDSLVRFVISQHTTLACRPDRGINQISSHPFCSITTVSLGCLLL